MRSSAPFIPLHADRYATPARVTFSHVYFSSERGDEPARARAVRALKRAATDGRDTEDLGDPFPT